MPWTFREIALLRELAPYLSFTKLAKHLNRSRSSISSAYYRYVPLKGE